MSDLPGVWSQVEVAGHTCDVYHPPQLSEHGYTVIYLHGVHLQRLVENAAFTEQFSRHGLRVIAPHAGPTWWTDRISEVFDPDISAEAYVLERILPYIVNEWNCEPPRVALLGTSMGGQGALRMAFKYPRQFPVVAGISPAIDYQHRWDEGDEVLEQLYDGPEAARQDTALLHVHPLNWPTHLFFACDPTDEHWFESAEKLHMKLASLGIPFDCELEIEAGGHGFGYYNTVAERAVGFIAERLERERLRIV